MSNEIKKYFLAPSWDYTPGDGRIAIGNLITDPTDAVPPMVSAKSGDIDATKVLKSHKTGVEWTRQRQKEKRFGIWTRFLALLGIGVNAGVSRDSSKDTVSKFEKMVTEELILDGSEESYVREAIKATNVKRYLERNRFKKPLYMIVGVKWVTGAAAKSATARDKSDKLSVSLDATGEGIPLSIGPEASISRASGNALSFEGSSDAVIAFRVRRVRIRKEGDIDMREYSDGALLGVDSASVDEEEEKFVIEIDKVDTGDATGELVLDGHEMVMISKITTLT